MYNVTMANSKLSAEQPNAIKLEHYQQETNKCIKFPTISIKQPVEKPHWKLRTHNDQQPVENDKQPKARWPTINKLDGHQQ